MSEQDPNFDLNRRQRELRSRQQHVAAAAERIDIQLWSGGAKVSVFDARSMSLEDTDINSEDVERDAAAHVLATFAAADGRLLRSKTFAPGLSAELQADAGQLRDGFLQSQGAENWSINRQGFDSWQAAVVTGGHSSFGYRNTIRATTQQVKEIEALRAGDAVEASDAQAAEPQRAVWRRADRAAEQATVQQVLEANLPEQEAQRVMGYIGRVERERGEALGSLIQIRRMVGRTLGDENRARASSAGRRQLRQAGAASASKVAEPALATAREQARGAGREPGPR